MRTTIEIPDALLTRAKQRALLGKSSLKQLFIEALEDKLAKSVPGIRNRIHLPIIASAKPGSNQLTADKIEAIEAVSEAHDIA